MIAATYTQGSGFSVGNVRIPEIAEDEILLRVGAASICGTDMRIVKNGHRKLSDGQKIVLGHEFAGTIEKTGSRVTQFRPGQRVGVAPNIGCGQCGMCIRGLTNMCPDYTAFGITFDGAHTEYVRIPHAVIQQGSIVTLPDNLSFREATLIEPLSCVINGIRASRIEIGDYVVVFGAGPIGLMHMLVSLRSGASKVIVADPVESRLETARKLGATAIVNPAKENTKERILSLTAGNGADVVITACSVASVQEQAFDLVGPYGRICLFGGLPSDKSQIQVNSNLIHYKNIMVTGMTGGAPADFRRAQRLIESKAVDVTKVTSHVFPISQIEKAYETALKGDCLKVVIENEG